ncbi:flagellar hook-basal body complex protein FliE [Solicola sp. PLA-1-18]|jgi:flagellar hook-basal body complex protein FliE|uniref:flagellar hook-basal body complex protein FliE n=1 Tax=Solicola sp. PLA-1-18 TaxID=3380532 RepID=UPI003B7D6426
MSIPAISGFTPYVPPVADTSSVVAGGGATSGAGSIGGDFAAKLSGAIDRLEAVNDKADNLAVQAATGKLTNIHDYTIAATEAATTTQLTTAVRNKAIEAFTEIMRMPV